MLRRGCGGVRSPSFRYGKFVPLDKMDYTKGPQNDNHPAYYEVSDNLICTIGLFEKQITGVELSMCRNITVSHNSIYNTPVPELISAKAHGEDILSNTMTFLIP